MNQHRKLQEWVEEAARLCQPEQIVWIDGSEEEKDRLTREAAAAGEVVVLNQEKLPGCLYHRTAANDVARTEDLTYICTTLREDAGPTNNWMSPAEGYRRAGEILHGAMRGRTMYVIPFSMGPGRLALQQDRRRIDRQHLRRAEHADHDARRQRSCSSSLAAGGEFTKCLHSKADLDIKRRLILHFPEDNTIWSVGSGYGGNVLLGKKCLSLRIASYLGKQEGWLAEHMLIMGVENPEGRVEYIAAAFPSACGKTNLAMLVPPEGLRKKGYRIWTVGDDIAWMRIDTDGRLWAINPETGFFGVAPGTNSKSNPNMMKTIGRNTIYTNVVLGKDGTVWWEGGEGQPPAEGWDWQGRPWTPGMKDAEGKPILGAHPNSRFTAPVGPNAPRTLPHRAPPRRADLGASSSAAGGDRWPRWSTRPSTGSTACSSGRRWPRSGRPPSSASSARSAATRWPCSPSAATTWATTSSTGWTMGKRMTHAAEDLPRQLVPHRRAGQVPLAGLRREPAGDRVDPRPLPRRGRRRARRPSATCPRPKAST